MQPERKIRLVRAVLERPDVQLYLQGKGPAPDLKGNGLGPNFLKGLAQIEQKARQQAQQGIKSLSVRMRPTPTPKNDEKSSNKALPGSIPPYAKKHLNELPKGMPAYVLITSHQSPQGYYPAWFAGKNEKTGTYLYGNPNYSLGFFQEIPEGDPQKVLPLQQQLRRKLGIDQ